MKQLIWVCGIIPEDINEQIRQICLKQNIDLHLSERFFRFPLHISMKRTFKCDQFEPMKNDLKKLLIESGKIDCGNTNLIKNKDMLWLCPDKTERIKEVHHEIDILLKDRYNVEIDTFDKNYLPHITIFHKGDPKNMDEMLRRLELSLPSFPVSISRYAIGSKEFGNEFIDI
ncbi:MAG: 2'-5' RNA ligase family protein [Erysipelotrichaceae bacterium]|nr:2'-5' RNA ligase family protein [Erysipelotrichaceae bacterium]